MVREKIIAIYKKEKFNPSPFAVIFNPFYIIRRGLFRQIAANAHFLSGRLLDFGCGSKPYKDLFKVNEYVGLDIEESGHNNDDKMADVYYDGKSIPFDNECFDSIFSSEVLEHVQNIDEIMSELHRVLKPDGIILITVPFVWYEHEIPYDYTRYTSFGIQNLLRNKGFEIIKIDKTTTYIDTLIQMMAAYLHQSVLPRNRSLRLILTPLFVMPINIIGMLLSSILPRNRDFYHNNVVVAVKK